MQSEAQENFLNFGHDNSFQNTEFQLEDSDVYSISSISSDSHMADYSSSEDEQAGKHGQTSLSTQNQGSSAEQHGAQEEIAVQHYDSSAVSEPIACNVLPIHANILQNPHTARSIKRPLKRFDQTSLFSNEFSLFHQRMYIE
jgi:hypothetical protein